MLDSLEDISQSDPCHLTVQANPRSVERPARPGSIAPGRRTSAKYLRLISFEAISFLKGVRKPAFDVGKIYALLIYRQTCRPPRLIVEFLAKLVVAVLPVPRKQAHRLRH